MTPAPVLLFAALAWLPAGGLAQQAPWRDATVDQMVEQLAPPAPSRGLQRNVVPQQRRIELIVNFDFDSAMLQPSSLPLLTRLAQALNTERLRALRFQVEGHTDAKGSDDYNQRLSQRRAQAVVAFLGAQGVAAQRLEPEGRGARELLNTDDPFAPENRRVRIGVLP